MSCIYCHRAGPYSDEHVLTRALSGPGENWVLRDQVCSRCNYLFSTYERAWTSEPGVAFARMARGPVGRSRKGHAYQAHPSEQMFLIADGDPVAYEVDLLPGIQARIRYQVIDTGTVVKPVASNQQDEARFGAAWKAFTATPEVTIQKKPKGTGFVFRIAILDLSGSPRVVKIEIRPKPASAWWDTFDRGVPGPFHPRLSLDPLDRIRFRTERLADIPKLLGTIFRAGEISSAGGSHPPGSYKVRVRSVYHVEKVHRAVAKTLVNYMADQFGGAFVGNSQFDAVRSYCLGGPDRSANGPFVGLIDRPVGIPTIDYCAGDRHALALASEGSLVVGVVKLYGHFTYRVHLGPAPPGTTPFQHGVRIDFNGVGRTDAVSS